MAKPQVLIRFKQGDHAYFDITGEEAFLQFKNELEQNSSGWMMIGPNAILKKEDLDRFFYYPDGYLLVQNSPSSVPKDGENI